MADLVSRLRAAGCVYPEDEAAVLRSAAVSPGHLEELVRERISGVPLEWVVGWADFCGTRVWVDRGVFVPRARTGLLVDVAAGIVPSEMVVPVAQTEPYRWGLSPLVVDLCCGSGAVGAAVAARVPQAEVHGCDLDPVSVACARRNLPPERVHEGNLYAALPAGLRGRVDLLLANAPYVPSDAIGTMPAEAREHEPRLALDGGPDGVGLHRRIAGGAREWLRPGGVLVVETSRNQAPLTVAAAEAAGLAVRLEMDDDRDATAVVAVAP